jgi:hypothetical protein
LAAFNLTHRNVQRNSRLTPAARLDWFPGFGLETAFRAALLRSEALRYSIEAELENEWHCVNRTAQK